MPQQDFEPMDMLPPGPEIPPVPGTSAAQETPVQPAAEQSVAVAKSAQAAVPQGSAETTQQPTEPEKKVLPSTPPAPAVAPEKPRPAYFRYRKTGVILAILLFLFTLGTLVPVGKIPFLRNIVYAMGYSADDALRMSLFQALFSWGEEARRLRADGPSADGISVFSQSGVPGSLPGAQNQLINMRRVNAALARKGRAADEISAAYAPDPSGEDSRNLDVNVQNADASADTHANSTNPGAVYFGTDQNEILRAKTDGYNSVNSLKKIANPNIAGAVHPSDSSTDWFNRLVDKATREDSQLDGVQKILDSNSTAAGLGGLGEMGDTRAKKDMYWAWLLGKAARRTPQKVLKKTLATTSFSGVELPDAVFVASGFSGVGINPEEVKLDAEQIQEWIELDKFCRKELEKYNIDPPHLQALETNLATIRSSVNGLAGLLVGSTCKEPEGKMGGFKARLGSIDTQCGQRKSYYTAAVPDRCQNLLLARQEGGPCGYKNELENSAAGTVGNFVATVCEPEREKCNDPAKTPEEKEACLAAVDKLTLHDVSALDDEVKNTFYSDKHDEKLNLGYFPGFGDFSIYVGENAAQ